MRSKVAQRLLDAAALRGRLRVAQHAFTRAHIDIHRGGLDARALHDVEGLAGIDRAELLPVANAGEAAELEEVGEAHQRFLVAVADHRRLVEQHDRASHSGASLRERACVGAAQQPLIAPEEARDGHRWNAGVALQHLHQRVLDGEPEHGSALLAQHVGEGLEDRALARARDALDRDDAIVRAEQQSPGVLLAPVQR